MGGEAWGERGAASATRLMRVLGGDRFVHVDAVFFHAAPDADAADVQRRGGLGLVAADLPQGVAHGRQGAKGRPGLPGPRFGKTCSSRGFIKDGWYMTQKLLLHISDRDKWPVVLMLVQSLVASAPAEQFQVVMLADIFAGGVCLACHRTLREQMEALVAADLHQTNIGRNCEQGILLGSSVLI